MKEFYYIIVSKLDGKPVKTYRPFGSRKAAQQNINVAIKFIAHKLGITEGHARKQYNVLGIKKIERMVKK